MTYFEKQILNEVVWLMTFSLTCEQRETYTPKKHNWLKKVTHINFVLDLKKLNNLL